LLKSRRDIVIYKMEVGERIKRCADFLDTQKPIVYEAIRLGKKHVVFDFMKDLLIFDPDLADLLLEDFEEGCKAFECALEQIDGASGADIRVRFENLPSTQHKLIWKLRAEDVNKLVVIKGFIRKISDVMHGVRASKFECPSCSNIMTILQVSESYKEPRSCGCGRRGKMREISREIYDLQKAVVEEDPQELNHTQKPRRIVVHLKNDLCREEIDKTLQPSSKVLLSGIVRDTPLKKESVEFKKYIDVHYIQVIDESFESLKFTKEEIEKFEGISKTLTLYDDMSQSIFPTIHGNNTAKKSIFLQLIGGVHLYNQEQLEERGTLHILLVGSPGSGKTQMLRRAIQYINNSRFTGGRGASGVGLVAAVLRDEELGGFTLDTGAIPMCNKSMCLAKGTLICTEFGIKEIENIEVGERIYSFNKSKLIYESDRVINTVCYGKKYVRRYKFQSGMDLIMTPEHPVPIWNEGVKWKKAGELCEGDYVICPLDYLDNYSTKHSKQFCIFFGLMASDGSVISTKSNKYLSFYNTNKEIIDQFVSKANKVLRLYTCNHKVRVYKNKRREGTWNVRLDLGALGVWYTYEMSKDEAEVLGETLYGIVTK